MRSQNIFFYFIQLVKTISLLSHTVVNMCVNAAYSHWVLSFSIVLLASTFLRSPFSIRSAQHSVEILSSIGSKVLLNTAANNSNQPKEKRGIYSKLFAHSLWTFFYDTFYLHDKVRRARKTAVLKLVKFYREKIKQQRSCEAKFPFDFRIE